MPSRKNNHCRYCKSTNLTKFLSLGEHPPSNSFIRSDQIPQEERYPLEVYFCNDCFLVQLLDVVPAEIIFDDYVYLSSTSQALKNHYAALVAKASQRFNLNAKDVVVDVGCNDGVLLHGYAEKDVVKVGVEPSKVAEIAKGCGYNVFKSFFNPEIARQIIKAHGYPKIVTATNVFVHVDDMDNFVKAFRILLEKDGVFIIEVSYLLDLIDQTLFDTIYHEHLCYLSLTPLMSFLAKHDLEVFDVERVAVGASGPAVRVYMQKKNGKQKIEQSVSEMLKREREWGVGSVQKYQGYAKQVQDIKAQVLSLIDNLRTTGKRIAGYGAPAKGNTLLNYFDLTEDRIAYIAETNTLKQGLVTPGTHIPIISEEEFINRMPDYALLLSWNYLEFFLKKSPYIQKGGKFIVPIPKPAINP